MKSLGENLKLTEIKYALENQRLKKEDLMLKTLVDAMSSENAAQKAEIAQLENTQE